VRFFIQHVARYALRHKALAVINILSVALGVSVYLAVQIANRSATDTEIAREPALVEPDLAGPIINVEGKNDVLERRIGAVREGRCILQRRNGNPRGHCRGWAARRQIGHGNDAPIRALKLIQVSYNTVYHKLASCRCGVASPGRRRNVPAAAPTSRVPGIKSVPLPAAALAVGRTGPILRPRSS